MNILFLYNSTQTYTNTVFEQINSFAKFSKHATFFCHLDQSTDLKLDLLRFDAVAIHYSVRLPFDQISISAARLLANYSGLKFLFIQDEYDHTCRAWQWINALGIHLVFTAVPPPSIPRVYPSDKLPGVRFVNNLTGYVPENLDFTIDAPASKREIVFGYRGRPLHIRYGSLGKEKVAIGELVRKYCQANSIRCDIAWTEAERIYGPAWYEFLRSCRAVLGSESGSNVFDWDNSLWTKIVDFKRSNPMASEDDIFDTIIKPVEINGIMNQVSPRVFETIAAGAVLVLFEGHYSGLIKPGVHFISLKKDGSNLDNVYKRLQDNEFVDEITRRAFQDVIAPGIYSYRAFVGMVDHELNSANRVVTSTSGPNAGETRSVAIDNLRLKVSSVEMRSERNPGNSDLTSVTTNPIFYRLPTMSLAERSLLAQSNPNRFVKARIASVRRFGKNAAVFLWKKLPRHARQTLKPFLLKLKKQLKA